jgi:methylamine dehydrogenase accessory protein MauD
MPERIWTAIFIALWILLLAQSTMLLFLSRHIRNLYHMRSLFPDRGVDASQEGLPLGAEVPEIEVTDLDGGAIPLGGAAPRKRLLIFLAPHCPACRLAIRGIERMSPHGAQIVLLWSTGRKRARELAEEYRIRWPMVADEDLYIRQQFQVARVPLAVVVDEQGRVAAKAFALNVEQLEALLAHSEAGERADTDAPAPAPPLVATR